MALIDNLLSYYKLDEASGNALDAHSTNELTDVNTVTSAAGVIGTSREFTVAQAESFHKANVLNLAGDFTLQAWIKPTTVSGVRVVVARRGDWSVSSINYLVYQDNDRLRFAIGFTDGAFLEILSPAASLVAGEWHHIVCVHNDTTEETRLYINGAAPTTGTYTGKTLATTALDSFRIGAQHDNSTNWNGAIDEVGVWDRVLTAGEVADLYNSGSGLAYESFIPSGPVVFSTQPTSQSVKETANATFSVVASGEAPITFQWQEDDGGGWANITGETSSTLTITAATLAMDGYLYRCVGTNGLGSVNSDAATLTVTATPFPVIVTSGTGTQAVATTSHSVAIPASPGVGNTLLVIFGTANSTATITPPAGFVAISPSILTDRWGSTTGPVVFAKISNGTESTPVVFTSSANAVSAHVWMEISKVPSLDGIRITTATGASTTVNPPNNALPTTYVWNNSDILYLAVANLFTNVNETLTAPSTYTSVDKAFTLQAQIAVAQKEVAALSEDPGVFGTMTAAWDWVALTIAIRNSTTPSHPTDITQFLSEVGYSADNKNIDITQFLSEVGYSADNKTVDITQFLSEVGYSADDKTVGISQLLFEVAYEPSPVSENQNRRIWVGSWI